MLADPDLSPEQLARIRRKLIDVADHSRQLIEQLLLLSATDQGLEAVEPVELDLIADRVVAALADEAGNRDVTVRATLLPLTVNGEAVLLDHMVHNLVGNVIRYNHPGGQVTVRVGPAGFEVSNTGIRVPAEVVPQLFEPFRPLPHPRDASGHRQRSHLPPRRQQGRPARRGHQ